MKKLAALSLVTVTVLASTSASAFFNDKNKWEDPKCWYNPNDCNPYDEWDPRYWTEEFKQTWDNNNSGYGPYRYGGPFGGYGMPYGGGYTAPGMMPYGAGPYGAGPYGRPMMPYRGPGMAPPVATPQGPTPAAPRAATKVPVKPYAAPAPRPPAPPRHPSASAPR